MFYYCKNIFEKISVVGAVAAIFILQGVTLYFLATALKLGIYIGVIGVIFVVGCIISFEEVYKRKIITEYQEELDYKKQLEQMR